MSDERPIGIFDSGLGGLTVVRELQRLLPHERIVYLGDTARVPYGGRSEETIQEFGMQDAGFLLGMDIKMLIVACNTVSSVALEHIQKHVNEIPVIGVVLPGSKAALLRTVEKKIGVIGTYATVRANAYATAIQNIDPAIRVFGKACPLFVPLVEEGMHDTDITRMTVQYYLYELIDTGIDCLILGCTHYPLLLEVITSTVGNRIQIIDSAFWTAKEAQDILAALGSLTSHNDDGYEQSSFHVTDLTTNFEEIANRFLGRPMPNITKIDLDEIVK